MSIFKNTFTQVLREQEEQELDISPESDEEALKAGLDDDSDINDFKSPDNPLNQYRQQEESDTIEALTDWTTKVKNFIEFLNGTNGDSINFRLNQPNCNSIMADVRRSESKKISRLAQDLSSLEEALKQYLMSAANKFKENEVV